MLQRRFVDKVMHNLAGEDLPDAVVDVASVYKRTSQTAETAKPFGLPVCLESTFNGITKMIIIIAIHLIGVFGWTISGFA